MKQAKFYWRKTNASEFLSPIDAYLAFSLITHINLESPRICEIGVWKGAWIESLCQNLKNYEIIGIDPYPGLEIIREDFRNRVLKKYSNVKLVDSTEDLPSSENSSSFDLIHIDGEHSEAAVMQDLQFAAQNISSNGVIVVDDIWHSNFPGIPSAAFKFIHSTSFTPFLISGAKMYICEERFHGAFHEVTKNILDQATLKYELSYQMGTYGEAYRQENRIKGYEQIITNSEPRNLKRFLDWISPSGLTKDKSALIAKKLIVQIIPPIVRRFIQLFFPNF